MGARFPTGRGGGIVPVRTNGIDGSRGVSMEPERGRSGMGAMVAWSAQPAISCESALVFEADLELDPIFDDLAVPDDGGRLHDLHRLDVADRLRRRGDRL